MNSKPDTISKPEWLDCDVKLTGTPNSNKLSSQVINGLHETHEKQKERQNKKQQNIQSRRRSMINNIHNHNPNIQSIKTKQNTIRDNIKNINNPNKEIKLELTTNQIDDFNTLLGIVSYVRELILDKYKLWNNVNRDEIMIKHNCGRSFGFIITEFCSFPHILWTPWGAIRLVKTGKKVPQVLWDELKKNLQLVKLEDSKQLSNGTLYGPWWGITKFNDIELPIPYKLDTDINNITSLNIITNVWNELIKKSTFKHETMSNEINCVMI